MTRTASCTRVTWALVIFATVPLILPCAGCSTPLSALCPKHPAHPGCLRIAAAMQLRGGSEAPSGAVEAVTLDAARVASWSVKEVLVWVDTLRDMLDAKTDMYMALFEENDVNGKVLLNLDVHKLEKVGVKSLGHREQIVDAIVSLREAAGMPHGPRPGEFEAAMRAQNAPPRHPPKLVATEAAPAAAPVAAPAAHAPAANSTWVTADRVAWSQSGRTDIEYFLFLDGVGSVPKEDLSVSIGEQSVEVRVRGLNGTNFLHRVPRTYGRIRPDKSFWRVRADRVDMRLKKADQTPWTSMYGARAARAAPPGG